MVAQSYGPDRMSGGRVAEKTFSAIRLFYSLKFVITELTRSNGDKIMFQLEFFTADELSKILRVPKTTLYTLSQQGKIPAIKIGKHWRYIKGEILKWVEKSNRYNGYEKII